MGFLPPKAKSIHGDLTRIRVSLKGIRAISHQPVGYSSEHVALDAEMVTADFSSFITFRAGEV